MTKDQYETRRILLGTIAVDLGFVDDRQIQDCLKDQQRAIDPQPLGQVMVRTGLITKEQLSRILKEQTIRVMEYSRRLRKERKQVRHELVLAREMQRKLIPKDIWVPEGLDVAHYYRPAGEVGGDFYDAGKLGDHGFWVAIGDVSGKGIPAAMVTGMLFTVLRMTSQATNSPAEILHQLNVMLHQQVKKGTFVTMQYLQVDAQEKKAHLATAGHNPILVVPRKGKVLEVTGEGAALGILGPDDFYGSVREIRLDLAALKRLVLYTDGVLVGLRHEDEKGGKEDLSRILETTRRKSCAQVIERLAREVARREKDTGPRDDIAVVAVGLS